MTKQIKIKSHKVLLNIVRQNKIAKKKQIKRNYIENK